MSDKPDVIIPRTVLHIGVALMTAAIVFCSGFILDTRVSVARLEGRVERTEQDGDQLRGLPAALARLEQKVDTLASEIALLRLERPRTDRRPL